jgi:YHS domain-containing protein
MRMLIWLILIYVGYKIIKGFMAQKQVEEPPPKSPVDDAVQDPVCGVYVTREDAVVGKVEGERIYFCSMECLEKYREQLEKNEKEALRP